MKIDSINQSEAISKYLSNAGSPSVKDAPEVNISDSVELSEGAQKFSALLKAAKEALQASGAEEEVKVADIISRMNNHSYQVSTEDIVSSILHGSLPQTRTKGE